MMDSAANPKLAAATSAALGGDENDMPYTGAGGVAGGGHPEHPDYDRDVAQQSIESDPYSPPENRTFDLADPGLFFFPEIPAGKLSNYPWLYPEAQSSSPESSEKEPATNPGSPSSPSSCDKCGKACRDAKALSQHKRCHHRKHPCGEPACAKVFSTRRDLERHREAVHERKPAVSTCPFCFKGFRGRADNLKRHMTSFCKETRRGLAAPGQEQGSSKPDGD